MSNLNSSAQYSVAGGGSNRSSLTTHSPLFTVHRPLFTGLLLAAGMLGAFAPRAHGQAFVGGDSHTYDAGTGKWTAKFTTVGSTNITLTAPIAAEYLVVGGGGGGNSVGPTQNDSAGGGGAGGAVHNFGGAALSVAAGPYTVTVGAGGAAGATGLISRVGFPTPLVALGGGKGGLVNEAGGNGACGGGAGRGKVGVSYQGGIGSQGKNGGSSASNTTRGGGGGGMTTDGGNSTGSAGGAGGTGLDISTFGLSGVGVGAPARVAGGGGGGGTTAGGAAGAGGGGKGAVRGTNDAEPGVDGTGGGGGGGVEGNTAGKKGGSGIVIIRYTIIPPKGTLVLMR